MSNPDDHTAAPDTDCEDDPEPWQEDPAAQLPSVIEPGRLELRLWSTPTWGDEPLEYEVSLNWYGEYAVDWRVITGVGLSVMSDVYFRGVAGWPDGENVLLNYTRDSREMGIERLDGVAPTSGDPADGTDPQRWVRFGNALVELTEQLLDSGGASFDGFDEDGYYDPARDEWADFDDVFRVYLTDANGGSPQTDFGDWFEAQLAAGRYTRDESSANSL